MAENVFQNHIVICGWNRRGPVIVRSLLAMTERAVLIVSRNVPAVLAELSHSDRVYFMSGDSAEPAVLRRADVAHAHSVLVLADDSLGGSADARSIQIALAVEKIRSTVYSVVEVRDLRNKAHFSWTKVDDMVSDQKIAVCLAAQGVRHLMTGSAESSEEFATCVAQEREFMRLYQQLLSPFHDKSQLVRLEALWPECKSLRFPEIIAACMPLGVLPVGLVGYLRHETRDAEAGARAALSWKTHAISGPNPKKRLAELWQLWPGADFPLGILALAKGGSSVPDLSRQFSEALRRKPVVDR